MNKPVIETSSSEARILKFLGSVDGQFTPPLSKKVVLTEYANKLARRAQNLFVVLEGEDVGHAAYYSNDQRGRTAFLTSICVKPKLRGSGLAELLLEEVCQGAIESGMEKISLQVNERNHVAVRFYKKHGFSDCVERHMEKRLVGKKASAEPSAERRAGTRRRYP